MKHVRFIWRNNNGIRYLPDDFESFPHHVQIKPWASGDLHPVVGLLLYDGIFCTISEMGYTSVRRSR